MKRRDQFCEHVERFDSKESSCKGVPGFRNLCLSCENMAVVVILEPSYIDFPILHNTTGLYFLFLNGLTLFLHFHLLFDQQLDLPSGGSALNPLLCVHFSPFPLSRQKEITTNSYKNINKDYCMNSIPITHLKQ